MRVIGALTTVNGASVASRQPLVEMSGTAPGVTEQPPPAVMS